MTVWCARLSPLSEARLAVGAAMVAASRDELPGGMVLQVDADLDSTATSAWSKDGHIDSFDRFMEDPNYRT